MQNAYPSARIADKKRSEPGNKPWGHVVGQTQSERAIPEPTGRTVQQTSESNLAEVPLAEYRTAVLVTPPDQGLEPSDPVHISETDISLADLNNQIQDWLLLRDDDIVPIILAAVAAFGLQGESVWLLVVGPSASGKTELIRLLDQVESTYPVSEITARTLASGYINSTQDPSLLSRLDDRILVVKDFTTVLELGARERATILAQLREIYDGYYKKVWGTGVELDWTGRVGFVAGVTPVIDTLHEVMSSLGQRFVIVRTKRIDRTDLALRAIENSSVNLKIQRDILADAVAGFVQGLPNEAPSIDGDTERWIASVADLLALCRSRVSRDRRSEIDSEPEPESPARVANQLQWLLKGLMVVENQLVVTELEKRRVSRVVLDTIPPLRKTLLEKIALADAPQTLRALCEGLSTSESNVRRTLEDLEALGIIFPTRVSGADRWDIVQARKEILTEIIQLQTVPDTICDLRNALLKKIVVSRSPQALEALCDGFPTTRADVISNLEHLEELGIVMRISVSGTECWDIAPDYRAAAERSVHEQTVSEKCIGGETNDG